MCELVGLSLKKLMMIIPNRQNLQWTDKNIALYRAEYIRIVTLLFFFTLQKLKGQNHPRVGDVRDVDEPHHVTDQARDQNLHILR